ncbi:MAG: 3-hydroxyacyl-CoA dehydrogenase NAD-binding domain-containing protein, partial [Acidimicrobiales bacterium]
MLRGRNEVTRVALVGGGVIGTGWAVRCLANGLDVSMADPAPGAEDKTREGVSEVWPTMEQLGLAEDASPERLRFDSSIEAAVADADFVQENVPEREELKTEVIAEISQHVSADAIIASSSSGLLPSKLQARAVAPGRVVIGHPFTPLYLLPLVEVMGGEQTTDEAIAAAASFYKGIGMRPLHVRNEIEAYIGDRLQEALWHEALHLVNDGVATIDEIDAAITGGPGLR